MTKQKSGKKNVSRKQLAALVGECCGAFRRVDQSKLAVNGALEHVFKTSNKLDKKAVNLFLATARAQMIAEGQFHGAFIRLAKAVLQDSAKE